MGEICVLEHEDSSQPGLEMIVCLDSLCAVQDAEIFDMRRKLPG